MSRKPGKPCIRCGALHNPDYPLCYQCFLWSENRMKADREIETMLWEEDIEIPESKYCVTCGREWGTSVRADGRFYCATCWTVWNS